MKQIIIVAQGGQSARYVCSHHEPPLNPNDPSVVILTDEEQVRIKMQGRLCEENELHVVGDISFNYFRALAPYFPAGIPEATYW